MHSKNLDVFFMKIYTSNSKMRDILADNSQLIMVMGRFAIPMGFADKTVKEVCEEHGVDVSTFLAVTNFVSHKETNYDSINLSSLIVYLKNAHEYFLDFSLPTIRRKLIESIDCSGKNNISMLILRFYDEYVKEVKRHMTYENKVVFGYIEKLLTGIKQTEYCIDTFAGKHLPIGEKLKELKDVIVRYCSDNGSYLLHSVLLDIVLCEKDLNSHCSIEDYLLVPAVKKLEKSSKDEVNIKKNENANQNLEDNKNEQLSEREKEIIVCIAKGLSNKEIADALFLSVHTVNTHRKNISTKLQIHSTAGIVIYAIANKLIDISEMK